QKTDRYATAITIHEGAKTLGALLETIGTNLSLTGYFLMVYLHSKKPGPINGAAHLFNRELLKRIGGIEIILNVLTEDAVFEKAFLKNGGRGVLAPDFVRVTQESQTLKGFWSRYVRWMLIARCYFPLSFISPIFWIGQWLLIFGFLGLPGEASPFFIACGFAVFMSRVLTSFVCQILQSTPTADWPKALILILSDSIMPFLWVWSRFGRHVQWAGKLLRVERNGNLVFVEKR